MVLLGYRVSRFLLTVVFCTPDPGGPLIKGAFTITKLNFLRPHASTTWLVKKLVLLFSIKTKFQSNSHGEFFSFCDAACHATLDARVLWRTKSHGKRVRLF